MPKALQHTQREDGVAGIDMGILAGTVGPVIRLLRNHLTTRILAAFEPYGLRQGSFSAMALIAANPGCSQADIARETSADKSVVVALVDELERKGLAERSRSSRDRRRNALNLTEHGHAVLREMHKAAQAVEAPMRDALTRQELQTLIHLNRKALRALVAHDPG